MKRRDLIGYGALGVSSLVVGTNLHPTRSLASATSETTDRSPYDWILLYWMPYDNDLSRFGRDILEMLNRGVQRDNILVLVQADFIHTRTLSR